jgi:hypothetical protein
MFKNLKSVIEMSKFFSMSFKSQIIGIFLGFSVFIHLPARANEDYIGMVKTYQPVASILRHGIESPVDVGAKLYPGDAIVTRSDAAVGIIFMDGSVLSLGAETRFEIVDFLFKPSDRNVSFISKISQGTIAFTSGAIGRISPESVKFITPTSTLGLHGTKVLIEVK